jgi:ATPase subunit of ABC transporter with duplicated ATPase domains
MAYSVHSSIVARQLEYSFPNGESLFRDINFQIKSGTYGVVGPNGVGKTTFLKLIRREVSPSQGSIEVRGQVECFQGEYRPENSVASELRVDRILRALEQLKQGHEIPSLLEMIEGQWNIEERISDIFTRLRLEVPLSRSMSSLSGGEKTKVGLARVLLRDADVLLMDEPTNNLDHESRIILCDFIDSWEKTLLVASHDRTLLSHVRSILELSNLGVQLYGGNYSFYAEAKANEEIALRQSLTSAKSNLKKEKRDLQKSNERQIKRMTQGKRYAEKKGLPKIIAGGLKRKAQVSFGKSKGIHEARISTAEARLQELRKAEKESLLINVDIPEVESIGSKTLVEVSDFNFRYLNSQKFLFSSPLSFFIRGPERIAIRGRNGSGKSTLLKCLVSSEADALPPKGDQIGIITLRTNRVQYFDQEVAFLKEDISLLENFRFFTPHLNEAERRTRLSRLLFDSQQVQLKVNCLSGGEKIRAGLACMLFSPLPPLLLILDEPTNYLDLNSIEKVEDALCQFQGALIVVSHDSEFLQAIQIERTIEIT